MADGPSDQTKKENSQSSTGGVGGETGEDGGNGEEGEAGREKLTATDVGVHRAGEEDASDGEPVGHVVGVGKDAVGLGRGEGERPALHFGDEGDDADDGDEPAVGAEEPETFLGALRLGADPSEPSPAGEEENQAFHGNMELAGG